MVDGAWGTQPTERTVVLSIRWQRDSTVSQRDTGLLPYPKFQGDMECPQECNPNLSSGILSQQSHLTYLLSSLPAAADKKQVLCATIKIQALDFLKFFSPPFKKKITLSLQIFAFLIIIPL